MAPRLRCILLLQRDVTAAARFYAQGLGLELLPPVTSQLASLRAGDTIIKLKHVDSEAQLATGYSPFLTFDVSDIDSTVVRLLQMGAVLDGNIKHETRGKAAALRAPDGHMLGLYETNSSS